MSVQAKMATGVAAIGIILLSACGGGGGDDSGGGPPAITSINQATQVALVQVSTGGSGVSVNTVSSSTVAFDPGNVLSTGRDFVRFVDGNTIAAAEAPIGRSATYTGRALVTVQTGATINGTMNSSLVVNFEASDADLTLNNITDAIRDDGMGAREAYGANGGEAIILNNLNVSGRRFSDDSTTTISAINFETASTITLAETTDVEAAGVFAGPNATEVAGGAISGGGEVTIIFTGKR